MRFIRRIVLLVSISSSYGFLELPKVEDDGKLWVILAAGSEGYLNYRHQADVCHAYQVGTFSSIITYKNFWLFSLWPKWISTCWTTIALNLSDCNWSLDVYAEPLSHPYNQQFCPCHNNFFHRWACGGRGLASENFFGLRPNNWFQGTSTYLTGVQNFT